MTDRREYIGIMVDAIMDHWRQGIHPGNETFGVELAEWWETDEERAERVRLAKLKPLQPAVPAARPADPKAA